MGLSLASYTARIHVNCTDERSLITFLTAAFVDCSHATGKVCADIASETVERPPRVMDTDHPNPYACPATHVNGPNACKRPRPGTPIKPQSRFLFSTTCTPPGHASSNHSYTSIILLGPFLLIASIILSPHPLPTGLASPSHCHLFIASPLALSLIFIYRVPDQRIRILRAL